MCLHVSWRQLHVCVYATWKPENIPWVLVDIGYFFSEAESSDGLPSLAWLVSKPSGLTLPASLVLQLQVQALTCLAHMSSCIQGQILMLWRQVLSQLSHFPS